MLLKRKPFPKISFVVTSCEWWVIFWNWKHLVFNCPLSLIWLELSERCFFWHLPFRHLQKTRPLMVYGVWRRSCYVPAGCPPDMGCWRPIGKASRRLWISEHVGKGPRWLFVWNACLECGCLMESSSTKSFLSGSVKRICVLNLFLGMIFFRNTEFHDVSWAI